MRNAVLSSRDIGLAAKLLARFDATVRPSGAAAIIELPDVAVTVSGIQIETLRGLLNMCDGKRALPSLTASLRLRDADLQNLVCQLGNAGVVVVAGRVATSLIRQQAAHRLARTIVDNSSDFASPLLPEGGDVHPTHCWSLNSHTQEAFRRAFR